MYEVCLGRREGGHGSGTLGRVRGVKGVTKVKQINLENKLNEVSVCAGSWCLCVPKGMAVGVTRWGQRRHWKRAEAAA